METLKQNILPYLKTDFEKDLLEAALKNLNDTGNKLRLDNFAYAAREFTRHYLKRLAPDSEVLNAPWFRPNDPEKPKAITLDQRIRYAIQGYLSDDFRENVLKVDLDEVSKNLKKSTLSDFQKLDKDQQRETLSILKDSGASVRQLQRLTGLGRGFIQRLNP